MPLMPETLTTLDRDPLEYNNSRFDERILFILLILDSKSAEKKRMLLNATESCL